MDEVDIDKLHAEAKAGNPAAMRKYGRQVLEGMSEPAAAATLSPKEFILLAAISFDRKASWLLCDYYLHGKYGFELSVEGAANSYEKTERRLLSDAHLSYEDDALKMEAIALYQQWRNWVYRHWAEQRIFERGLTNEEHEQLKEYKKLVHDAQNELNESCKTGFMRDAKSAVYDLTYETASSVLPGEVKQKLQEMSDLAMKYVVGGPNEQVRATTSLHEVRKIEEYVGQLLGMANCMDKSSMKLTEDQKQTLLLYRDKVKEAQSDLDDSMETEYMSDTKSSVYALEQEENFADLPDEVTEELKRLSAAAWKSVVGVESVYRRFANTSFNVAEIERYVNRLLGVT